MQQSLVIVRKVDVGITQFNFVMFLCTYNLDESGEIYSGTLNCSIKLGIRKMIMLMIAQDLREAFKSNFWKNLGIWPNQVDPPPSPPKLGPLKLKKILMFILHFRLC